LSWRFFQHAAHGGLVGRGFGDFRFGRAAEHLIQNATPAGGVEPVEAALAGAAVFDQAGLLQLREVGGDGALAHGENFLQLGDGKLLAAQQQQDAEPVGVGDDAEDFYNRGHIPVDGAAGILIHINISRFDDIRRVKGTTQQGISMGFRQFMATFNQENRINSTLEITELAYKVADMSLADWGRKEITSPSTRCRAWCRSATSMRRASRWPACA
jgi:hypothetical protein